MFYTKKHINATAIILIMSTLNVFDFEAIYIEYIVKLITLGQNLSKWKLLS